jgi:sporulation protein YlmC with PRC-barrel domain
MIKEGEGAAEVEGFLIGGTGMRKLLALMAIVTVVGVPGADAWGDIASTARWSLLKGKVLVDPHGDRIGSVYDAVFDSRGRIRYVIVEQGGLLGIGARLVPVPIHAIRTGTGERLTIDVPRHRLADQPFFYGNDWTWMNFDDHGLDQQVQAFYDASARTAGHRSE